MGESVEFMWADVIELFFPNKIYILLC